MFRKIILAAAIAAVAIMALGAAAAGAATDVPTPGGPGPDLAQLGPNAHAPITPPGRDDKIVRADELPPRVPFEVRERKGQNEEEDAASTASLYSYISYRAGGWTQTSPKIYVLFWGDWTSRGDPYGVQTVLWKFYAGIGGSGWNNTQTQYGYNCGAGSLGCTNGVRIQNNASQAIDWAYDASAVPTSPTFDQMAAEAQKAANYWGDRSVNAQYVIATATGHRDQRSIANGFCAWHNYTFSNGSAISFTSMPYLPDRGTTCGMNKVNAGTAGITDGVTILAGHEYAESETGPFLNAWPDSDGYENADKCLQWSLPGYFRNISFSTGTFAVQPNWSNYAYQTTGNGCVFWS